MITLFFKSGQYPDHVIKLQKAYKEKRDVMAEALNAELGDLIEFSLPAGGMFFWVKFPARRFHHN